MKSDDRSDLDDLLTSLARLSERVTDAFLRVDTLRALMIEYGVFSQADFELELQERQTLWSNRVYYLRGMKREADKIARRQQRLAALKPIPR